MASTARNEEDKKEYFDSPEEVERKASELAGWIKASKHVIAFTVSQSVSKVELIINRPLFACREQGSALQLEVRG